MIDYKELPDDGVRFEQLLRELLIREGYETRWTGVGPDGGRDLLITEKATGPIADFKRTWLVSCKHKAHSGASVGVNDLDASVIDSCKAIDASGYILACSTQPSSALMTRFGEIENNNGILCKVWDAVDIEKRLMTPRTFSLISVFFPKTSASLPWSVFNAGSPTSWCGSNQGHFFYMESRMESGVPRLADAEAIIAHINAIKLGAALEFGQQEMLRLRAIYYDDKNSVHTVFIDYIVPTGHGGKIIQQTLKINDILNELEKNEPISVGPYELNGIAWDVVRMREFQLSDSFDRDAQEYYTRYMSNFQTGSPRDGAASHYSFDDSTWRD